MAHIPFPLSSSPGRSPQESRGRLVNCYAEALGADLGPQKGFAPPPAVWRRSPGNSRFATTSASGFRGGIRVASTLFAAFANTIKAYDSSGNESPVGTFSGTSKCFWARNNALNPNIVVVDPDNGAFSVTSSSVTSFADPDLPAPCDVFFQDSYLFFPIGDGRIFVTDQAGIGVDPLNFARAETRAGGLLRGVPWNGQAMFFGPTFIEVWADTANPTGFPYTRSLTIPRGLIGRYALAGHEEGFGGALMWVADDSTVVRLNGYVPEKVSPPDLDRLIAAVEDKDTLEASVYVAGGHARWVLSCADWSWEFDLLTQKWNERQSYQIDRWRCTQSLFAFNRWIYGDTKTGNLLAIDDTAYEEDGEPLVMTIESGPVVQFPHGIQVARADFAFIPGTGIATGDSNVSNPTALVSWSRNGGGDWSVPLVRKIGPQATDRNKVTVTRAGLSTAFGHRWRVQISDPVYAAMTGGEQVESVRAAA